MSEIKKALPTHRTVTIGENEKVEVEKLPLGKYAELLVTLRNVPTKIMSELQQMDGQSEEESLQMMLGMFGEAWGQILDIIAIGTGVDRDRIENDSSIGIDGGIELFFAVYEVNNLSSVVKQVKNQLSRQTKK